MKKTVTALVATIVIGCGSAFADPIVVNGNFETGDFTGWSVVLPSPLSVIVANSVTYGGGPGNDTGTGFFAAFGGGGTSGGVISQSLSTQPGRTYDLLFQYGAYGIATVQSIEITAGSLNTTVTSGPGTHALGSVLSSYDIQFTAVGSTTVLTFADTSTPSLSTSTDGFLDNVSVAPEPAGLLMIGVGLTGLTLARRRSA